MAQRRTVDSMRDNAPDFTANEMHGMMVLTATRAAVTDVVAVVRSTVAQEHLDGRSGSAVMAAAPQLEAWFGLLIIPEADLDQEERRLGEELAAFPVPWGIEHLHSSPQPVTTHDNDMEVGEMTVDDTEEVPPADDALPEEVNMPSSSSSTSVGSSALSNLSSDEERMRVLEEHLTTARTYAAPLQSNILESFMAQQTEQEPGELTSGSLAEEVSVRETWGLGEEGAEEMEMARLRAIRACLKLASLQASSQ
ncbi:hypothetical protein FRC00_007492 [Tulasnella sp. 408]|nr:hypothetical protein FRC00_007492 [Tulasnella sp. 408]